MFVGDSFIKRLNDFQRERCGELLCVEQGNVDIRGYSGARVRDVSAAVGRMRIQFGRYSVAVISVGSNDFCDARCTPEIVCEELTVLARVLVRTFGVAKVIICQVLRLQRTSHHFQRLSLMKYNAAVDKLNSLLNDHCTGTLFFWRHHHGVLGSRHLLSDGVHLNEHGMKAFRRSLIRALSYL